MVDVSKVSNNLNVKDISQQNIYNISQQGNFSPGVTQGDVNFSNVNRGISRSIEIDREVANLVNWLAEQQGLSPDIALKKAVFAAAYIYDVTTNQQGRLLVQRKDNSVGEIILK